MLIHFYNGKQVFSLIIIHRIKKNKQQLKPTCVSTQHSAVLMQNVLERSVVRLECAQTLTKTLSTQSKAE